MDWSWDLDGNYCNEYILFEPVETGGTERAKSDLFYYLLSSKQQDAYHIESIKSAISELECEIKNTVDLNVRKIKRTKLIMYKSILEDYENA